MKAESTKKLRAPFKVSGIVIKGKLQGSRLGFPTANIALENGAKSGIYVGQVRYAENDYPAAIYVGPDEKILEAHLLDFKGELYNQRINVAVLKKIREVEDFVNYDDLVARITKDIEEVRKFHRVKKD